jgi:hypothetical protein
MKEDSISYAMCQTVLIQGMEISLGLTNFDPHWSKKA